MLGREFDAIRRGRLPSLPPRAYDPEMTEIRATVEAVCLSTPERRVAKQPQEEANLGPYGFEADRHAGEFVRMRNQSIVENERQWSAVSSEEVAELCAELGVPAFAQGELGENLRLGGVRLADVPPGTIIEFPSGARLKVGGPNDPCVNAAAELAQTYGPVVGRNFVQRAYGRRGVVGTVLSAGLVRTGDSVRLLLPEPAPQTPRLL
jgi:hypothetical protein